MKKLTLFLTVLLLLLAFAGCQGVRNEGAHPSATEAVSQSEAQQIALEHAGVKAEDVTGLRSELDYDDGISHYNVEFHSGDFEYSYEIDKFGNILSREKDYEPKPTSPPELTEPKPVFGLEPTVPDAPAQKIDKEAAKNIALEYAGVTSDSVKFLKVEFDREDNTYDVEFEKDGMEYSYEIDANSGKILEADKDLDD